MIDLYYWPTPNGHKITLFLEEASLAYTIIPVNIGQGAQFEKDFLAISPNNKMPAIVDRSPAFQSAPFALFESGAILEYLAEKTGKFLATDPSQRYRTLQWLYWQMAGLGPMTGQYGHFHVYAPEHIDYAKERYRKESLRLLSVLDAQLQDKSFVMGDEYSIADMAIYPWVNPYTAAPLDLTTFKNIERWHASISARPATQRAYALGKQVNPNDGKTLSAAEKAILFGSPTQA